MSRDDTLTVPTGEGAKVEWLNACARWALEKRRPYEERALQGLLFWAGDQWSSVERTMNALKRRVERPPFCDSSRVIDNQIIVHIRQVASMSTEAIADFEAVQATSEPQDVAAASLATKLIKMRERVDKEAELREEEILWMIGCGEVLRKTWYDPRKVTTDGVKGDIASEVVPLFRYAKCPSSGWDWPPKWLIEFDARHVDWVKAEFGKSLEPEDVADEMRAMDELAMNVVQERSVGRENDNNHVIVYRMYCAATEKHPKGRVFVWSGNTLLKEHEFQSGVFPFSRATWYPIPNRLYPISFIEPIVGDQKALNTLLSQLQEVKNRDLRKDVITDGVGQVVQHILDTKTGQKQLTLPVGGQRWEFLNYEPHIRLAQADYERLMKNIHDKSGTSEPVLGQAMSRKTTATELQLLREASFQGIAWVMNRFDRHCAEVCQQKVLLAHDFFTAARILTGVGTHAGERPIAFFGSELRNTQDVVAIPTPKLTPAMRRQAVQEAMERGLFGPWYDQQLGLPDPILQYAARRELRARGLVDEEEQLANVYGPFEDLEALVSQLAREGQAAWIQLKVMQVQQLLMMGGQMMNPAQGQPMQGGAVDPLAGDMSQLTGLPGTPMSQGQYAMNPPAVT